MKKLLTIALLFISLSSFAQESKASGTSADDLAKKGKIQYLYGDFEAAKATFLELSKLEPNSYRANTYLELIEKKIKTGGKSNITREEMLKEVNCCTLRDSPKPKEEIDLARTKE